MRSVLVHFILAVVGLGLAYGAWTSKDEAEQTGSDDSVTLVDCKVDQLSSIAAFDGGKLIRLEKKKDKTGDYYWMSTRVEVATKPKRIDTMEFATSKEVKEYLEAALPLRAERSLGQLTPAQLKETKLDAPDNTFTLECGGKKSEFDIGAAAFGSGDYYFRPKGSKTVYLMAKNVVGQMLQAESSLMQRSLFAGDMTEVNTLIIRALGKEKKLLQHNRLDKSAAQWVDADAPTQKNELYGNWMSKLTEMRVERYLAPGAEPGQELEHPVAATPLGTIEFLDDGGKRLEQIELAQVQGETPYFYARSSATRAWTRVLGSIARQVSQDLAPVLGLESTGDNDSH